METRFLRTLVLVTAFAGCSGEPPDPPPPGELLQSNKVRNTSPGVSADEREQFTHDRAKFAIDLYRSASSAASGNLFFSPHSISLALGMTWAGAAKETKSEMASVMSFSQGDRVHAAFNDLDLQLAAAAGDNFQLRIVNQLFGQKNEPFVPAFLDVVAENYGAGLRLLDFMTQPDPSRQLINQWVSAFTKDLIRDLIPEGVIDADTRLVLANAIYFKATWAEPFDKNATANRTFHTLAGGDVMVPAMNGIVAASYATGNEWEAVEIPYKGERAALLVMLPAKDKLGAFEQGLDADLLAGIVNQLAKKQVDLTLPKFSIEARLPLKSLLERMGMNRAFDANAADFSAMDTNKLHITDALHKAFVRVDEEGTEAAAATAVTAGTTSAPVADVKVVVDRPFLMAVRDRVTGAVLFLGLVVDPQ